MTSLLPTNTPPSCGLTTVGHVGYRTGIPSIHGVSHCTQDNIYWRWVTMMLFQEDDQCPTATSNQHLAILFIFFQCRVQTGQGVCGVGEGFEPARIGLQHLFHRERLLLATRFHVIDNDKERFESNKSSESQLPALVEILVLESG